MARKMLMYFMLAAYTVYSMWLSGHLGMVNDLNNEKDTNHVLALTCPYSFQC